MIRTCCAALWTLWLPVWCAAQTQTCAGAFCCNTPNCYDGQLVNPFIYSSLQPSTTCAGVSNTKRREWWVVFVPATTGNRVFTFNPDTGPVGLRFYTGTCAGLTQIACFDYTSGGTTTTINLTAGVTYYVQMTTPTDPGSGNRTVEVDMYQNPSFADAQMSCPTALPLQAVWLGAQWLNTGAAQVTAQLLHTEGPPELEMQLERRYTSGAVFEPVGERVLATNADASFQWVDATNPGTETTLYRLRVKEATGQVVYSPEVELAPQPAEDTQLAVYPNPVRGGQQVSVTTLPGVSRLRLVNAWGQTLGVFPSAPDSPTPIIAPQAPGLYWVVPVGTSQTAIRLVVQ